MAIPLRWGRYRNGLTREQQEEGTSVFVANLAAIVGAEQDTRGIKTHGDRETRFQSPNYTVRGPAFTLGGTARFFPLAPVGAREAAEGNREFSSEEPFLSIYPFDAIDDLYTTPIRRKAMEEQVRSTLDDTMDQYFDHP